MSLQDGTRIWTLQGGCAGRQAREGASPSPSRLHSQLGLTPYPGRTAPPWFLTRALTGLWRLDPLTATASRLGVAPGLAPVAEGGARILTGHHSQEGHQWGRYL